MTLWLVLLVTCWFSAGYAQQAVPATGGDASGSGGSTAYSVGQVAYISTSAASGSISQGVEQPYEIYILGIMETGLDISLNVYPNPTVGNLTLEVKNRKNARLSYRLFDIQGSLIESSPISNDQTQINLESAASATYFIQVIHQNKSIQSFKIIKN